jgi:hypothetical protein
VDCEALDVETCVAEGWNMPNDLEESLKDTQMKNGEHTDDHLQPGCAVLVNRKLDKIHQVPSNVKCAAGAYFPMLGKTCCLTGQPCPAPSSSLLDKKIKF